jgi:hypothetical protein
VDKSHFKVAGDSPFTWKDPNSIVHSSLDPSIYVDKSHFKVSGDSPFTWKDPKQEGFAKPSISTDERKKKEDPAKK